MIQKEREILFLNSCFDSEFIEPVFENDRRMICFRFKGTNYYFTVRKSYTEVSIPESFATWFWYSDGPHKDWDLIDRMSRPSDVETALEKVREEHKDFILYHIDVFREAK